MHPHGDLVAMPARAFVLGDGLEVGVSVCTATVWHPRADPERLHVLLTGDADDSAAVVIDVDLLTAGMSARVDRGRATVWPCWDDDVVCLGLHAAHHVVLELPRPALANVLADVTAPTGILRQRSR